MINNILSKIEKANKIEEVKLTSQKVELGLKEDAVETVKLFISSYSKVDDGVYKFYNQLIASKKQYQSIQGEINNLLSFENKLKSEQNKILAAGKELGIDVTNTPFYMELTGALNSLDKIKTEIKNANSAYKNIKL